MTGSGLRRAGWLAMVSAISTLPLFWWSVTIRADKNLSERITEAAIQVAGTALFVILSLLFRRLLRQRHRFHGVDRIIDLLIISNLLIGVLSLIGTAVPALAESVGMVLVPVAVAMGILQARFGYLLLALPVDLGGLRTPYAYLNMVAGICLASIVLVPVAIIAGAIADVMLGTIFFQSARSISTTA